jgi:hypothetical protein
VKDWTGNKKSIFTTLGASNHVEHDRAEHDYYATEPRTIDELLSVEDFVHVWEPACGEGHMADRLWQRHILVRATDIVNRGYEYAEPESVDFLKEDIEWQGDIITNPPYKYAQEFVEKALAIIPTGRKVAMFLKLTFLEGQKRKKMFQKYPPKTIYVYSSRRKCAINGDFDSIGSSASAYAWFVWEKGYQADPIIKWLD